ncbi:MarR family transcriptional regulator [Actinospica durhamensis]|uniref:MarR family transcriptional regulator n=1 Tax=Actinospica durhamensis TaxID=1508375 RepID=A0A941IR01_9ACTN|nr:MarR family transcriptional regulator [Actinospica durhamensis]MBR7836834.1 MarR family transcriptional regulator [Actinospica durhamensis]
MSNQAEPVGVRLGAAVQGYQGAVDDFDRELARLMGVNETDLRCLEILLGVEQIAPKQLAERLGLTTGSVTTMLDRLEKLEYLTRSPNPADGRSSLIRITQAAALRAYGLIGPFLDDATRRILERFEPEQLETVIAFLTVNREIQEEHTARLRAQPAPRPPRSGGRQSPGPRTGTGGTT